jgi:Kef-type K+ transport system membrane component KefB
VTPVAWGVVLCVAALIAMGLQLRRWRARRITTMQFAAGMIARAGFLFLGITYAAELVYRWRRAPLIGLGIVALGIILNLIAGIIENIRRARAPYDNDDETQA